MNNYINRFQREADGQVKGDFYSRLPDVLDKTFSSPQPPTKELTTTTDKELEREAAELYQYPEHNLYRPDSNEEEIWTIDRERAAHIKARKMSIRLKEREIAEKALRNFEPFNETITDFLDTNYPIIK